MRVLVITGDKQFGPGHPRYDLQKSAVDELVAVYWGRGSYWPRMPIGRWDVVSVQDPFWRGLFAWLMARRLGAKFNVQVHTDLSAQPLVRHVLAQIVLRHADSVRVVSEKVKSQVLRLGAPAPVVLPVFVDVEPFRALVPVTHARKTIVWVGRFEPEKDPLFALEALRQVRDEVDAALVMLGAGSLEQSLRTAAHGLPVQFPGWQDPKPFLAAADVVLSTSRHESWGASIVEALAAGVPVVAPDVGIVREAGALVVPRQKLAGAVAEILRSGQRGELKLRLLSKEDWVKAWRASLKT